MALNIASAGFIDVNIHYTTVINGLRRLQTDIPSDVETESMQNIAREINRIATERYMHEGAGGGSDTILGKRTHSLEQAVKYTNNSAHVEEHKDTATGSDIETGVRATSNLPYPTVHEYGYPSRNIPERSYMRRAKNWVVNSLIPVDRVSKQVWKDIKKQGFDR